ncbi:hypothetical protein JTE90_024943 [Oedothorax gibbosus]|uniref:Potassium channel domain-containing protein n=1 Tax=Oedothorax gibbosus TaxID=931172 RepID=A0AAV6TZV6_9ARAC|nr:hypothetical protein JTE90_024943 [Oedothorax gibbosus]
MAVLASYLACQKQLFQENKKGILLVAFTIGFAGYLALGGLLFLVIEGPQERLEIGKTENVKTNMLKKYPQLPSEAVDEIFQELTANGVKGIVVGNSTPKWTYGNSLLFSVTLLTTVGYGHLSPSTSVGKVATLCYSSIGIPLTLLLLALYVDRLVCLSEHFKENLFRRLGRHVMPHVIRLVHYATVMVFILLGCFILPAWVFCWLEVQWTYLDALYFCVISLTTIGLGDFVPGIAQKHPYVDLYRFGAALYLICGVTTMMFMMAATADFVRNYNKGYQELLPLVDSDVEEDSINKKHHSYGTMAGNIDRNDNIMQP